MRYDFKCNTCKTVVEYTLTLGEYVEFLESGNKCSRCDKEMSRAYAPPNIKFVGSGFYVNDYK